MRGLNLTILRGYTGSDPEVREVGKTSKVAEVRLATDESYYNSDGELIEQTEWHSLVFWGNNNKGLAEVVEKYISKGSHIEVIGKLKTETWETDDNETRSRTKVVVSELKIISTPNNEEDDAEGDSRKSKSNRTTKKATTTSKKRTTRKGSSTKAKAEPDDELPY